MDQDENEDSPPPAATQGASPRPADQAAEDAFALWLQRSLHQLYDGVTREPIPPELLRLIEQQRDNDAG